MTPDPSIRSPRARRCRAAARGALVLGGLAALLAAPLAQAHSFGRLYNLPVPVWMYLYGAAAALVASFAVLGLLLDARRPPDAEGRPLAAGLRARRAGRGLIAGLRMASVATLVVTIACGLAGARNPYLNLSMTLFWVVFVLGWVYLTFFVGDLWDRVSPWRVLVEALGRRWPRFVDGRLDYPSWLGYAPALALYMIFIWIELFGATTPRQLAILLLGYTALNLAGAATWGATAWLRHGELFAVLLRLVGRMAPLAHTPQGLRLRAPFVGLLQAPAERMSLLLFVLFMLSSTAFDGLRETVAFVRLFWSEGVGLLQPFLTGDPRRDMALLQRADRAWQTAVLLASPLLYLALYLLALELARRLTRTTRTLRELALRFAMSLVPIAFVYHATHYCTLLLIQGSQLPRLLYDPLGSGWDPLGVALRLRGGFIPDAEIVWHTQVGLIVLGHVVGVWLAHVEALRLFESRRAAALSQLPMLLLMVAFTTIGLWILAQPLQSG